MDIRLEEKTDFKEVEYVIREAFWNLYRPGCYEHFIVHNLRYDPSFIKELDYVIDDDGKIIGHIAYSKNGIFCKNDKICDVVTLGPICVHPDYQRQGNGTKLMEFTLKKAEEMDIPFVFTIGDENFYQKFGFESASKYGVKFNDAEGELPFFMIKILDEEKVSELKGVYKDNELFNVDEEEVDEFDKRFPPKTKEKREGQLNF